MISIVPIWVLAGAVLLAIPSVSFGCGMLLFPLLVHLAVAVIANFGPVFLALIAGVRQLGMNISISGYFIVWLNCGILWVGGAYGLSRWGDVAAAMGAKNKPFWDVLIYPWLVLFGVNTF